MIIRQELAHPVVSAPKPDGHSAQVGNPAQSGTDDPSLGGHNSLGSVVTQDDEANRTPLSPPSRR